MCTERNYRLETSEKAFNVWLYFTWGFIAGAVFTIALVSING